MATERCHLPFPCRLHAVAYCDGGETLKPIVETTVPWDVVDPRYVTEHEYKPGRSTWSWILWQDDSANYDDQVRYVDLAAAMGYEYILVDSWWDKMTGYDRMEKLVKYAHSKGVGVFLWYSSSGYWNDIEQSPINKMDNSIIRKRDALDAAPGSERHQGRLFRR